MEDEKKFEKFDKPEEKKSDKKSDKHTEKKIAFTLEAPATVVTGPVPTPLDLDKLGGLANDTSYGVKAARLIKGYSAGNIPLGIFVGDMLLLASKMANIGLGPFEDAKKYLNSLIF